MLGGLPGLSGAVELVPRGEGGRSSVAPGGLAGPGGHAAAVAAESSHSHRIPKGSVLKAAGPLLRAGRSWWVSPERAEGAGRNLLESRRHLPCVVGLGEPESLLWSF